MSQTHVPAELRRLVRRRAQESCEYFLLPEAASFALHQVDHIIAEKHGGPTHENNLALSCILCNNRKGSDLSSIDQETGKIVPLFHPRQEKWTAHFQLVGGTIEPLTPTGRVTIRLLQVNHPDRIAERELLLATGQLRIPAAITESA